MADPNKTQTQLDTDRANRLAQRDTERVDGLVKRSKVDLAKGLPIQEFGKEFYIHETGQDTFDVDDGGNAGVPQDFAEETLDIVEDDNTAGQRIFLTKEVP